jgi:putative acetyltransferase
VTVVLQRVAPDSDRARHLIDALDRYLLNLYPPESNHLDSTEELSRPHVRFICALERGCPVGCGAVKLLEDYGEIKRVYIDPRHRGKGIGRRILSELEAIVLRSGIVTMRLETGTRQPEALSLFESSGYERTGPYGHYPDDPLSVFMRKVLLRNASSGRARCADPL